MSSWGVFHTNLEMPLKKKTAYDKIKDTLNQKYINFLVEFRGNKKRLSLLKHSYRSQYYTIYELT